MIWTDAEPVAAAPPESQDPFEVADVADAILTPWARGPLFTDRGPTQWIRGAVHDRDGALVTASQRHWNRDPRSPIAADPQVTPRRPRARRLEGTWIYAGHWNVHFGHFLLETLTNLWPDPDQIGRVDGILAHRQARGVDEPVDRRRPLMRPDLRHFQEELLRLSGWLGRDIQIVHGRALNVERLLVPTRPVLLKRWVRPPAVELWRRMANAASSSDHRRVFLSRSRFHMQSESAGRARTQPAWDQMLDRKFAEAGFHVVFPESLAVSEQIALASGAEIIAGPTGSALHLAAFAAPGTGVLAVGDNRIAGQQLSAQRTIEAACGLRSAFLPYGNHAALDEVLANLPDPVARDRQDRAEAAMGHPMTGRPSD